MAISLISAGALSEATASGQTVTPGLPAGYAAGDIFILVVQSAHNSTVSNLSARGYTNFLSQTGLNRDQITLYWKRATDSETAPTWTSDAWETGRIFCWRGCLASGTPIHTNDYGTDAGKPIVFPAISTAIAKCMIIHLSAFGSDSFTWSAFSDADLASCTDAGDFQGASNGSFSFAYGIKTAPGLVDGGVATAVATNTVWVVTFSLIPETLNVAASSGSFAMTGTAATLTFTEAGTTLEAAGGSIAVTGTAAGFLYSRIMPVSSGSYSMTGTAATLAKSSLVGAGSGSYAITGTAATLIYNRGTITLSAESADFYIMGPIGAKTLKKSLSLVPATEGSFAITGTAAGFLYSHVLAASPGSHTVTGSAATFLYSRVLTASPGEYTVTGTAVDFVAGMGIAATTGSFAVTGTAAGLCKSYLFSVSEGTFAVTGTAATFDQTKGITASSGTFEVTGTGTGLLKSSVLVADPDKSSTVITRYVADAWEGEFAQASLTTTWTPTDLPDDIAIVCFGLDSRAEIASVTLGGVAFTKLTSVEGTGGGYHRGELWYLVNPPHVESEFAITLNDSQGTWTIYRVEHYYNVNQYDPFGDVAASFAAGQSSISNTVEDVQPGQFPFDWIVNTIVWYALTPGVDQTVIANLNTGHFAHGMSHRFGDTGDLAFSWSFPGIAADNIHIATVFEQPSFRNIFTITGSAATLLKIIEMTINDATHGITMSGIVLIVSAAQELVIEDSTHALTMGNVTLTMPDTLTIADAAHALTMQNVGLVMPGTLTINDATHALTMPNIALGGITYGNLGAMINIGGAWKTVTATKVQTDGEWKDVTGITLRQ